MCSYQLAPQDITLSEVVSLVILNTYVVLYFNIISLLLSIVQTTLLAQAYCFQIEAHKSVKVSQLLTVIQVTLALFLLLLNTSIADQGTFTVAHSYTFMDNAQVHCIHNNTLEK
jgi:hypothetical protein